MPELDSRRFYAELEAGTIRPVYWLSGENGWERDRAAARIKAAVKPDEFNFDSFYGDRDGGADIAQAASSAPVFAERRLVLVRRAGALKADGREAVSEYLKNPLESTCLVLVAGGGEGGGRKGPRGPSLSALAAQAGAAVEFEALRPQEAQKWAAARAGEMGAKLPPEAAETLVESSGADLSALENEIAKLAAYKDGAAITSEDVLQCLGYAREAEPFALSDAISAGDGARALRAIDAALAAGEEPVVLLAMMAKYAERMLRVKIMLSAGMEQGRIAAELGVKPYYAGRLAAEGKARSERSLFAALNRLLEADAALKSSSGSPAAVLKSAALAQHFLIE
ncbi:MAG: DNA polymerase III subunit delta [Elusimicrobiales bacterium]